MSQKSNSNGRMYSKSSGLEERFQIIGAGVMRYDHLFSSSWRGDVELSGLSLREPQRENGEFLVVLRGFAQDGTPMVAFHSSLSAPEALAGAAERMANGTLKWKIDGYRTGQTTG